MELSTISCDISNHMFSRLFYVYGSYSKFVNQTCSIFSHRFNIFRQNYEFVRFCWQPLTQQSVLLKENGGEIESSSYLMEIYP